MIRFLVIIAVFVMLYSPKDGCREMTMPDKSKRAKDSSEKATVCVWQTSTEKSDFKEGDVYL